MYFLLVAGILSSCNSLELGLHHFCKFRQRTRFCSKKTVFFQCFQIRDKVLSDLGEASRSWSLSRHHHPRSSSLLFCWIQSLGNRRSSHFSTFQKRLHEHQNSLATFRLYDASNSNNASNGTILTSSASTGTVLTSNASNGTVLNGNSSRSWHCFN